MKIYQSLILSLYFTIAAIAQKDSGFNNNDKAKNEFKDSLSYYEDSDDTAVTLDKDEFDTLKNGYILIFRQTRSLDYLLLQHGLKITKIDSEEHGIINRGLEADNDNYFMVFSVVHGTCPSSSLDVFKKDSGINVFFVDGWMEYEDTLRKIYVFDHDTDFIIYDFTANKFESFKEPIDNNPLCRGLLCDCWNEVKLTDSELNITYKDSLGVEKTVHYKRLNKEIK